MLTVVMSPHLPSTFPRTVLADTILPVLVLARKSAPFQPLREQPSLEVVKLLPPRDRPVVANRVLVSKVEASTVMASTALVNRVVTGGKHPII